MIKTYHSEASPVKPFPESGNHYKRLTSPRWRSRNRSERTIQYVPCLSVQPACANCIRAMISVLRRRHIVWRSAACCFRSAPGGPVPVKCRTSAPPRLLARIPRITAPVRRQIAPIVRIRRANARVRHRVHQNAPRNSANPHYSVPPPHPHSCNSANPNCNVSAPRCCPAPAASRLSPRGRFP